MLSGTSGPADSRASVGCSLRTSRCPWHPHVTVSHLCGPRCLAVDPLSPLSRSLSSHPRGSCLPSSPAGSFLGVRSAGSPSVCDGRPLSRPPPSYHPPISGPPSGSAWGVGGGDAGRGGRAGRGGDAGPAGLEARQSGAGAQSRVRPAEPRAPRPRPVPPPGRPAGEGA